MPDETTDKQRKNKGHDNLIPFVKGDPRINRKGRPKGQVFTERFREELMNHPELLDETIKHFFDRIKKSDKLLAYFIDRIDGKPTERVITTEDKTGEFFGLLDEALDEIGKDIKDNTKV